MEGWRIACFFSFVSLLLLILALTTDYWVVESDGSQHVGLWRECLNDTCTSLRMGIHGFFYDTRIFLLMGMVAGAVSFFGLCASFSRTHIGSTSTKNLAISASFVAGVCSMIAMSIFTGVYKDEIFLSRGIWLGWSFGVGWASFPLFLITCGLACKMDSSTP